MSPQKHHRPRKRYGQHFLVQPGIARRIVAVANLTGRESVLEIGPGRGALTPYLAEQAKELWLIEVDRDLHGQLCARFAEHESVHILQADILEVNLPALLSGSAPVVVVANLPYNISTPVLMKLLETPDLFSRLVLMLQLEVAERLRARPGTKDYGALSVLVQVAADVRIAFRVGPGSFVPRPKVDSAVVVIEPLVDSRRARVDLAVLRRVVKTAFNQRRKQLVNALSPLVAEPRRLLAHANIDPKRRPDALSVSEFVALAQALEEDA
jgi:16S rRNA (adenine1518-N6/adenine1519-N6)-dimethyltransferase